MESMVEYFGSCLSVTKIPLAYVVRKEIVPEQAPIGGWPSNEAEMISCALLVANVAAVPMVLADHYKTDNKTVWTKLAKMCCDHDCWTFIHQHQKAKNGQLAFRSLYNHYLGTHHVDTLCAHGENKLTTTVYHGEMKWVNWECYMHVHMDQHAVLQGMMEDGYTGIDEQTMVWYLLVGIKTSALTPCTANLMATQTSKTVLTEQQEPSKISSII
jgi:hypothetical protein